MSDAEKPIAIYIMQILLVPATLIAFLNIFGLPLGQSLHARLSWVAFWLTLTCWLGAVLFTLALRKPLARWLGAAVIGVCTFLGVYGLVIASAPTLSSWLGAAVVVGAGACWLYGFAFSPKARRYFALPSHEGPH